MILLLGRYIIFLRRKVGPEFDRDFVRQFLLDGRTGQ